MSGSLVPATSAALLLLGVAGCTAEPPSARPPARPAAPAQWTMDIPRAGHSATLLASGQVLLAGGCTADGCEDSERGRTAEVVDPRSGRVTARVEMTSPRTGHTATRLADGRVLLAGGYSGEGTDPLETAEIYDPGAQTFSAATTRMTEQRGAHTATLLRDGRVLLVGGVTGGGEFTATAEVFDPATGSFAPVAAPREAHAAGTATPTGAVVVLAGGQPSDGGVSALVETYDPAADRWRVSGRLSTARYKHAAVVLRDGSLLVIGGGVPTPSGQDQRLTDVERLDPATGQSVPAADLTVPRYKLPDTAVLLSDGTVVVAGGAPTAERYDPSADRWTGAGEVGVRRSFAVATVLPGDAVLVTGGYDEGIRIVGTAVVLALA